jgi:hypothetical protein
VATSQHQWSPALGVPFESIGKNTIADVQQEIIKYDDSEFDIDGHFSLGKILNQKRRKGFNRYWSESCKG